VSGGTCFCKTSLWGCSCVPARNKRRENTEEERMKNPLIPSTNCMFLFSRSNKRRHLVSHQYASNTRVQTQYSPFLKSFVRSQAKNCLIHFLCLASEYIQETWYHKRTIKSWINILLVMVSSSLYVSHMFVTRVLSSLVFRVVLL